MNDPKYKLARGAQVRKEDFGLLFYKMHGPRLYFLASGDLLQEDFFQGHISLEAWIDRNQSMYENMTSRMPGLKKSLRKLTYKGVIIEC